MAQRLYSSSAVGEQQRTEGDVPPIPINRIRSKAYFDPASDRVDDTLHFTTSKSVPTGGAGGKQHRTEEGVPPIPIIRVASASRGAEVAGPTRADTPNIAHNGDKFRQLMEGHGADGFQRAWQQYHLLEPEDQAACAEEVLTYLERSTRNIDLERIILIFNKHREHASSTMYRIALKTKCATLQALLAKGTADATQAVAARAETLDIFLEAYRKHAYPVAAEDVFVAFVTSTDWDRLYEVMRTIKRYNDAKALRAGTSLATMEDRVRWGDFDFAKLVTHPSFAKDVAAMADEYLAEVKQKGADGEESSQTPAKWGLSRRQFVEDMAGRALFPENHFTEKYFRRLFGALVELGAMFPSRFDGIVEALLERRHRGLVVTLYRKYKSDPRIKPSRTLQDQSHTGFVPEHGTLKRMLEVFSGSSVGTEMLADWDKFYSDRKLPAIFLQQQMTYLADHGGDVTAVYRLWHRYLCDVEAGKRKGRFMADIITPLMTLHARRGEVAEVEQLLEQMESKYQVSPTTFHFNILINAYSKAHAVDEAFDVYERVLEQDDLTPDEVTISTMMGICIQHGDATAARDFFRVGQELGLAVTTSQLDCLVAADILDGNLETALGLCKKASRMELDAPVTRMWNSVLLAYGFRNDLDSVNRLIKDMKAHHVPLDEYTYSALMQALCIAGQAFRAQKILTDLLPQTDLPVTEFHYAVVMGGYLRTKEFHRVAELREMMLEQGFKEGGSTRLMRFKHFLQSAGKLGDEGAQQVAFKQAQDMLFDVLAHAKEDAFVRGPKMGARRSMRGYDPVAADQTYTQNYYEYYIFQCAQSGRYQEARAMCNRYLDEASKDPAKNVLRVKMLSALMICALKEGDHKEVEALWKMAYKLAVKQATLPWRKGVGAVAPAAGVIVPGAVLPGAVGGMPSSPLPLSLGETAAVDNSGAQEPEPSSPSLRTYTPLTPTSSSPDPFATSPQRNTNSAIPPTRVYDLSLPFVPYLRSLAQRGRWRTLARTVGQLESAGFALDRTAWNLYVQALVRAGKYHHAFFLAEEHLMPWFREHSYVRWFAKRRNRLSPMLREARKRPEAQRPLYHTLLFLGRAWIEMESRAHVDSLEARKFAEVESGCPNAVRAVRTLRRVGQSELETEILEGDIGLGSLGDQGDGEWEWEAEAEEGVEDLSEDESDEWEGDVALNGETEEALEFWDEKPAEVLSPRQYAMMKAEQRRMKEAEGREN
jgi:pentatricopeptide repeat-containing protein PET309